MESTQGMGRAGVAAIIGRPSAGKSSFLNTVSGRKISIVSPIPQTTRNTIRGIINRDEGQLVFIDTPGCHISEKKMNIKLKSLASDQLEEADALLYIIDTTRPAGAEEEAVADLLKAHSAKTVAALNKCDSPHADPDRALAFVLQALPLIPKERIVRMSATEGTGTEDAIRALFSLMPESPPLYPEEYYTDQEVEFRITEIIREQALNRLREELPHSIYVQVADMEKSPHGSKFWVRAFLCVEKESQKGMVIGKGARLIKEIRVESIKALRAVFPYRIDLDLQVKVDKNWRQKDRLLNKLIT